MERMKSITANCVVSLPPASIARTKRNFHKRESHAPAAQAAARIMDLYIQLCPRNVIYRPVKTRRWHVPSWNARPQTKENYFRVYEM